MQGLPGSSGSQMPGMGSLDAGSITPASVEGSVAELGSLAAPLGSVTASLGAPLGSLGILLPVALVGGSIAAGSAAMPMIQQSLAGGGIQLPALPALPAIPGVNTGSLPGQQAPQQQAPTGAGDNVPQAPAGGSPDNGRG